MAQPVSALSPSQLFSHSSIVQWSNPNKRKYNIQQFHKYKAFSLKNMILSTCQQIHWLYATVHNLDNFLAAIEIRMWLKFLARSQNFFLTEYLFSNLNFSLLLYCYLCPSHMHRSVPQLNELTNDLHSNIMHQNQTRIQMWNVLSRRSTNLHK